jgi:hypothetical protein
MELIPDSTEDRQGKCAADPISSWGFRQRAHLVLFSCLLQSFSGLLRNIQTKHLEANR